MARAGCGCFLIILSMVLLFAIIVIPVIPLTAENRTIDDYLKTLLCEPSQRLVREQYSTTDFDGTGYSMTVFCETSKNVREDVTAKWTIYGIIGFLAPFLFGLLLFLVGIVRRATKAVGMGNLVGASGFGVNPQMVVTRYGTSTSPVEGIDYQGGVLKVGGMQVDLNSLSSQAAQAAQAYQQPQDSPKPGSDTLATKLKQIQEARDAGLISSSEYDRLRQEILDNMG